MFLEKCSYPDVEHYLEQSDTVVIPVGSLENHGKHMPLGTDTMIPDRIAHLLDERMPGVMIAPIVPYGATEDLKGFAGTVSIGSDGLQLVLTRICEGLYAYGFRRFIILNGHGGNNAAITAVGHTMFRKGAYVAILNWWLLAGQLRPEWKGGHGGGEETAAVMGIDPSLIHREYLTLQEGFRNDISDELPSVSWTAVGFKGGQVTIPRPMHRITDNGWDAHGMGIDPPTKATEAWGREMLDVMADYAKDFIEALQRAPLPGEE